MEDNNVPFLYCNKTLKPEYSNLQKICISSADFTIGRDLKNSVVIPFLAISRHHCNIRKINYDTWLIEDYSSYGIIINGVKLGKGNMKRLRHRDVISLEPSHEFIYSFIDPSLRSNDNDNSFERPKKRMKSEKSDSTDIINNVKKKFELSQSFELQFIEEKIEKAQQMQRKSILLKNHIQTETVKKIKALRNYYTTRIESLKGEKSVVEEQKALLIVKRETKLAILRLEMEKKISNIKTQIELHNVTETDLVKENNLLKQKLLKEKEEFLAELNTESSSKHDMLDKLEAKLREQEESHLKEKRELQETLRKETERLNIAKEKELKSLEEKKKSRESELLQELDILKNSMKTKMKATEQQEHQVVTYVSLNNKMDKIENLSHENKIRVEKLVKEREELRKKLVEAKLIAYKSITELKTRVQDRETELAALAAERIQKYSEQSTEVINSLLEQLDKVKSQLKSVESEKDMLKAMNETVETSTKESAVAEFTDIMESELQCSICSELFVNSTTLNCSHTFCKSCITKWQKNKRDCPICRRNITSECKSLVLDSFIEKVVENMSPEMKKRRLELLKLRQEEEAAIMMKTANRISNIPRMRRARRAPRTSTTNTSGQHNNTDSSANRIPTVDLTTPSTRSSQVS